MGNAALFQKIENVRAAIHAARLQRAFLFREIEQRNVFERNVVEIEVAAKPQLDFHELRQPAPENAPAGDRLRQPLQEPQLLERRMLRVVDEVAPVAMLVRPASGKNGRHAGRTVTEDGFEPFAPRRHIAHEGIVPDDFPSAGIDEDEQRQHGFHVTLPSCNTSMNGHGIG